MDCTDIFILSSAKSFNQVNQGSDNLVQCPISGGPAVYKARPLYFLIDPDIEYDDENSCLQSGYLYRTSRNLTHKSKLYPNPASNDITVVYNVPDNSLLQIMDVTGRIIKLYHLNQKEINFTFNISTMENGMYLYRIIDTAGNMIDTGQFIISK